MYVYCVYIHTYVALSLSLYIYIYILPELGGSLRCVCWTVLTRFSDSCQSISRTNLRSVILFMFMLTALISMSLKNIACSTAHGSAMQTP